MHKLKIAYFGSPIFSAQLLEQILNDNDLPVEVVLVVTQPDKPVGRQLTITPSPVKEIANKYGVEVWDKQLLAEAEIKTKLGSVDLALVFAYGFKQLIPIDLLKAPKMQFINIHPSLLPKFRGSSPIAYPILLGENKTGVTLFVMDEKMDHGPIISQQELEIGLNDVRTDMEKKLTDLGFQMIKQLFNSLTREPINPLTTQQQNHSLATRAPYMKREDGFISFETLTKALKNEPLIHQELPHIIAEYHRKYTNGQFSITNNQRTINDKLNNGASLNIEQLNIDHSSKLIYDFWRGMHPWPGVWTLLPNKKRLKIIKFSLTTNYQLLITKVQLEGKNEVDFPTFQKAYGLL